MTHSRQFNSEQYNENLVHDKITPIDIRDGHLNYAIVKSTSNGLKLNLKLRIWRMSPLGVELVEENSEIIPKGIDVDLEIHNGHHKIYLSGLIVDEVTNKKGLRLLHIRLTPRPKERMESVDRRTSTRWICSEDYFPTAVASNPAQFNDFIYFRVKDISNEGLKLYTSLRNRFLVPSMSIDCLMDFPMITQVKIKLEIKSIRIELENGKEVLAVGVQYNKNDRIVKNAIKQYLIQFSSVKNLEELRQQGIEINEISTVIQYSFVKSKEDYEKVLQLRLDAYKAANKVKEDTSIHQMGDSYDARSRIVMAKFKGEVIASARLIFNKFEDQMEQEKFITWPTTLPRRDEMVEVMRACTHNDFRRSDLFFSLLQFIAVTVAQTKKNWIVICATDDIMPLYKKIGFQEVGLSYNHTGLNGLKHNILLANVKEAMEGKTVGPIVWNVIWSEVSKYLEDYGVMEVDPVTQIRLFCYRLFRPAALFIYNLGKFYRSHFKGNKPGGKKNTPV